MTLDLEQLRRSVLLLLRGELQVALDDELAELQDQPGLIGSAAELVLLERMQERVLAGRLAELAAAREVVD